MTDTTSTAVASDLLPGALAADCIDLTAAVVAAYVADNSVPSADLPGLIRSVHDALAGLGQAPSVEPETVARVPAVPVKRSVFDDHLVSLIDGKPYKTLKRHIGTHGMTPDGYRAAFGLPANYPMVAPAYAANRSALAKTIGLGRKAAETAAA